MNANRKKNKDYKKLFNPSKLYFIESRKSELTGVGRIAKSILEYADSNNIIYSTTKDTIFKKISQFSLLNMFLLFFTNKESVHIFPYTIFPPIGLRKIEYIFYVHDLYQFLEGYTIKNGIYRKIFIHFIRNASLIVFVSNSTKEKFYKIFKDEFCEKEYYIISNDVCSPLDKVEKICFYVGSNKKNKNLALLEKIAKIFVRKPDHIFVFVGINEMDLKERSDDFIFLNGVQDSFLSFLYENVDYFVCTSTDEGFCFPVMDALHHGAMVLALQLDVFIELYENQDKILLFDNEYDMIEYVKEI